MAKVSETQLANILRIMKDRKMFQSVTRMQYIPVDMEWSMSAIEVIGKARSNKFRIDVSNRFVYENIIRWLHADTEFKCLSPDDRSIVPGDISKGIYIAGNTGTGKTWCIDIMAAYSRMLNLKLMIGGQECAMAWTNIRADVITNEFQQTGDYFSRAKTPMLCIQDLGAESQESIYMGNRVNVLRSLLEYRGDRNDQITLVTSNLPMMHKAFSDKYGDRVASRMREMCNYFELTGQDRRKL